MKAKFEQFGRLMGGNAIVDQHTGFTSSFYAGQWVKYGLDPVQINVLVGISFLEARKVPA